MRPFSFAFVASPAAPQPALKGATKVALINPAQPHVLRASFHHVFIAMSQRVGDYHGDYRSLNEGAHRKAGIEVDTPSVTRHLGFWFPTTTASFEPGDAPPLSVQQNGAFVDALAKTIYAGLRDKDRFETNVHVHCPNLRKPGTCEDAVVLFGDVFVFEHGVWVRQDKNVSPLVKGAFESDNRILTMKAMWRGLWAQVRFDFHSEYFTLSAFLTLSEPESIEPTASSLATHLSILPAMKGERSGEPGLDSRIRASHRFVYHDIWDLFFEDIGATGLAGPTRIFADFRGIVLAGHEGSDDGSETLDLDTFKRKGDAGSQFARDWAARRLVPRVWPFLVCERDLDMRHREFTVSYMLQRRADYLTALGPQPVSDPVDQQRPVHYLLVCRPANDWQLGNLIDRLHFMGTVRLAGLMELNALRSAGANLKAVESVTDKARKALKARRHDLARYYVKEINRLIAYRTDKQPLFWSGLQFRVERSRYYISRFRSHQKYLRVERVEGYEPYHQFIEGRLGSVYDYIDRLGNRHERAVRSSGNLSQEIQSEQAQNIIDEIRAIQFKAEIALLAILLPYYAIGSLHYIFDAGHYYEHGPVRPQIFATIAITFPILSFLSFLWFLRKQPLSEIGGIVVKAVVFVAFFGSIGAAVFYLLSRNGFGPAS